MTRYPSLTATAAYRPHDQPIFFDGFVLRARGRVVRGRGVGFRRWVLPGLSRVTR